MLNKFRGFNAMADIRIWRFIRTTLIYNNQTLGDGNADGTYSGKFEFVLQYQVNGRIWKIFEV